MLFGRFVSRRELENLKDKYKALLENRDSWLRESQSSEKEVEELRGHLDAARQKIAEFSKCLRYLQGKLRESASAPIIVDLPHNLDSMLQTVDSALVGIEEEA